MWKSKCQSGWSLSFSKVLAERNRARLGMLIPPEATKGKLMHIREPGQVVLRRDKTAWERLYMINKINQKLKEEGCHTFAQLTSLTRTQFRQPFGEDISFITENVWPGRRSMMHSWQPES